MFMFGNRLLCQMWRATADDTHFGYLKFVYMASASSTSARSLFVDSKLRLADRVQVNVNNIASVARQIQRGARSNEVLMHAARNFALQEHAIENSESNLKKLQLISAHLGYQQESLLKSAILVEEVKEQVRAMQR